MENKVKIKICGLTRHEDIEAVNSYKPEYCGFIVNFPRSRRNVNEEKLKELTSQLCDGVIPVGVFVDESAETVARLLNGGVIKIAQLHGHEGAEYIKKLRSLTDRPIWQAFQVRSRLDIDAANESTADFVLLDNGQGSGSTFSWDILSGMRREFALAGGINEDNLALALKTGASLLDISGGAETDGLKDERKIKNIVERVRSGA